MIITKEQFIDIISQYSIQDERLNNLENLGFNIWETPIIDFGFIMFDLVIKTNFTREGQDWINWWLYERDNSWNSRVAKAFDEDNNEILTETTEDLWNIVEKYRV